MRRAVSRLATAAGVVTGRPPGELARELWGVLGVECVRRLTYVLEVAAFRNGLRGHREVWTPAVRPLVVRERVQVVAPYAGSVAAQQVRAQS